MGHTGFWPLPNTKFKEFFRKANCYVNIIMSIVVSSAELWEGFDNKSNTAILIEAIVTSSTAMMSILKAIRFLTRRDYMIQILQMFDDLNENSPVDIKNETLSKEIEIWKNKAHRVTKLLILLFLVPFTFYMTVPWYRFIKDDERNFPFPSKFPIDKSIFINYFLLYILEFLMAYVLIWTFIGSESFFANSVLYICSRLEVLKYSLTMTIKDAKNQGRTTKQFGKTIEYHKRLLK